MRLESKFQILLDLGTKEQLSYEEMRLKVSKAATLDLYSQLLNWSTVELRRARMITIEDHFTTLTICSKGYQSRYKRPSKSND